MFPVRRAAAALIAASSLLLGSACARSAAGGGDRAARAGAEAASAERPARIVSLAPATTAILVEIGMADRLVAVDTWSRLPDSARDVPRLDMIRPDAELLLALGPDVVFASSMTKEGLGRDPFAPLSKSGVRVEYIPTSGTIRDIEEDVLRVAGAVGEPEKGEEIVRRMRREIGEIRSICAAIPEDRKPIVVFEIAPAPSVYSFGSGVYLDEMLAAAGARNAFAKERGWLATGAEAIVTANPDVILTNVDYLDDPVAEILSRPAWSAVNAVKNGRVYRIDNESSSQPAPAVSRALAEIARACHPELFDE